MDFTKTQFQWKFRNYQQSVLDEAEQYLADGKIHIVAAPGSGKTILGLELIRRHGNKALVLSPSIAIRQQWVDRFKDGFLNQTQLTENWCSENLEDDAMITSMTYQGLYSAMATDSEAFITRVKKAGIKTFCFDEAHHLKRQWWQALDILTNAFSENIRICLTATPPYDSDIKSWNNYINLCGEIDCEISIPELVKEKSLCPHQDYVYMSLPNEKERNQIKKMKGITKEFIAWLLSYDEFKFAIENHPIFHKEVSKTLLGGKETEILKEWEIFLENPEYLTAFLSYCKETDIRIEKNLKGLIGSYTEIPKISPHWIEMLLQGYLFIDPAFSDDKCKKQIMERLRRDSLLRENKLYLDKSEKISKILINSQGKLEAIGKIVRSETEKLGDDIRMLILTDYIKKDSDMEIGAVPIYNYLLREGFDNVCLLTGSLAKIPEEVKQETKESEDAEEAQIQQDVFSQVRDQIASGQIKIIVGTVAYLGEGWDAPWINSLILATTVRSYVTSNQMRGRAIRYLKERPEKTSAIWHLLSMDTTFSGRFTADEQISELKERFLGFMGLTLDGHSIENGIDRLNIPMGKLSETEVHAYNDNILKLAGNRELIRGEWQEALVKCSGSVVKEKVFVNRKTIVKNFRYYNSLLAFVSGLLSLSIVLVDRVIIPFLQKNQGYSIPIKTMLILLIIGGYLFSRYGYELLYKMTPQSRFSTVSEKILMAMIKKNIISEGIDLVIEENGHIFSAGLINATLKENTEYAKALTEFYGPVDNPRYLITEKTFLRRREYYPLPSCFGSKKEDVELLIKELNAGKHSYDAHYLRNPKGRQLLLRARLKAYYNKQRRFSKHNRVLM